MTTTAHGPQAAQTRVVRTLVSSQILGSLGMSSGIAVGALLAEEISGSDTWAGLGTTFQVFGAALIAIPMAHVMARSGRRPGLILGYTLAILGAVGIIAAAVVDNFALLLAGSVAFGGATASNNQARYAATDLAHPDHRGRDLSTVVWATTIGAVVGPNLAGPGADLARPLGLPVLAGPFVFSLVGFVLAVLVLTARLRPDPLLEARRLALAADGSAGTVVHGSVVRGLRVVFARRQATFGLLVTSLGHATMVSVMVMTPLHMDHGGADLRIIGLVISGHVLGMFAFSPLTGRATDRFGAPPVALAGAAVLIVAGGLAARAPEGSSAGLAVALFLLGLGWSCTLVAGSTLLVAGVPQAERPGAQGGADLVMGLAGGGGGALAGVIVNGAGFGVLAVCAMALPALIVVAALVLRVGAGDDGDSDSGGEGD
ncbi:MFS transporter [Janibacter sp. G1551]|uniref:MFS transporter n=1 Tax=Janibacter sp. G1551 TaxID=3420440 RepID=UPI003CFEA9C9